MSSSKLLIFDYDGVIADSLFLWEDAFRIAGKKHDSNIVFNREYVGRLEHIRMESVFENSSMEKEKVEQYTNEVFDIFRKRSSEVGIYSGVPELIKKVYGKGNIICINTANNSSVVKIRVESEGIGLFISNICGSDTSGSKSEKIFQLMEKHGFSPECTYMIGDSLGDITEGKKAGVKTIGVSYGWQDAGFLRTAEPDYLFRSVKELEEFLLSL